MAKSQSELSTVKGVGPATQKKLEKAGTKTVAALKKETAESLAEKSKLSRKEADNVLSAAAKIKTTKKKSTKKKSTKKTSPKKKSTKKKSSKKSTKKSSSKKKSSTTSSKDATRAAFQAGLIRNGEVWMEMIKSRNKTSHTYNKEIAEDIFSKVVSVYYAEFSA